MGVRSVLGREPLELAIAAVGDDADKLRRMRARDRREMYLDNPRGVLERRVDEIFAAPEVRARVKPFLPLAAAQSLFKRVVDEIARPVYSPPPTRTVLDAASGDEVNFALVAAQSGLDAKLDLACRLVYACNSVHVFARYVSRLGVVLDVITPDQRTVIPDPDDTSRELAIIYDLLVRRNGKSETLHVYWDDEETFRFDDRGELVAHNDGEYVKIHGIGMMPFVPIHRRERWGTYEDETSGSDLAEGAISLMLLHALVLKLHRDQGEKQIVVTGDIMGIPKGQVIDGGGAIVAPDGTSITTLDLATDPRHYLATIDSFSRMVAANHGLSVDRINARGGDPAADVALLERRAEAIKIFAPAERRIYEVIKAVSKDYPLSPGSHLGIEYAQITAQADPLKTLEIWDREIRMGLRSPLDCVRERQPEVATRAQAKLQIRENATDWAETIDLLRKLNIRNDADAMAPGKTPAENGADGPRARGAMTPAELRSMAQRLLRGVRNA